MPLRKLVIIAFIDLGYRGGVMICDLNLITLEIMCVTSVIYKGN